MISKLKYCVKSVRIRNFLVSKFPEFGLNIKGYSVSFCIQSECGKIRTRNTSNTGTFYAMKMIVKPTFLSRQSVQVYVFYYYSTIPEGNI